MKKIFIGEWLIISASCFIISVIFGEDDLILSILLSVILGFLTVLTTRISSWIIKKNRNK